MIIISLLIKMIKMEQFNVNVLVQSYFPSHPICMSISSLYSEIVIFSLETDENKYYNMVSVLSCVSVSQQSWIIVSKFLSHQVLLSSNNNTHTSCTHTQQKPKKKEKQFSVFDLFLNKTTYCNPIWDISLKPKLLCFQEPKI